MQPGKTDTCDILRRLVCSGLNWWLQRTLRFHSRLIVEMGRMSS